MPLDIRYVVLSDLHLGQDQSLLTRLNDGTAIDELSPSPTLLHLMGCLRTLIAQNEGSEPPTLILLGDAMELALSDLHVSAGVFEQFAGLLLEGERSLFKEILFVPGNHDHHLWVKAKSLAYTEVLGLTPKGRPFPQEPYATPLQEGITGNPTLLGILLMRAMGKAAPPLRFFYPDLLLLSPDRDRALLLNHGHYFESIYTLMSQLSRILFPGMAEPATTNELERENYAWIDFFWSALGRQGPVGDAVERVYDSLPFPDKLDALVNRMVDALIADWDANVLEKKAAEPVLEWLVSKKLKAMADQARLAPDTVYSEDAWALLEKYLSGPLKNGLAQEKIALPKDITLVFGHTHKPFETQRNLKGFADRVKVYNTGGWVVDPAAALMPLNGGAAVLFNEHLESTSLRFWNEAEDARSYQVKVACADPLGNAFHARIQSLVDRSAAPFEAFSKTAAEEVRIRFELVARVLSGTDTGAQD